MMWKNFKDENMRPFFTKEFADTHIGLMLSMDWFQPFINSQYSIGVIYAVICNLPQHSHASGIAWSKRAKSARN